MRTKTKRSAGARETEAALSSIAGRPYCYHLPGFLCLEKPNDGYYIIGTGIMAIGLDGMLSTSDAAEILNVSESRVRQFVFDGRLEPAGRLGVNLLFDRKSVVELSKKKRKWGRPKKSANSSERPIAKSKRSR